MWAKDSEGAFKFLRSPVVYGSIPALQILQQYGPLPKDHGAALLAGVDKGAVTSYHGPGYTLWYFPSDVKLPTKLPWVDAQGSCKGSTPVVASEEFEGWAYAKVPHWARLNVPTELLTRGSVCARAYKFPTVHDVRQTQGTFKDKPGVICGVPGRMQEIIASGYDGILFVFVTSSDAPAS